MTQHTQNRRQCIVVNAPAQWRMVASFMLQPTIALVLVALLTGIWCAHIRAEAVSAGLELPDLMPFFWAMLAFEVGAAIFLVGAALRTTLRVSGPAYNICRCLQRIRHGDLGFRVKLRDGDYLTEIESELNQTIEWLQQHLPATATTAPAATANAEAPAACAVTAKAMSVSQG